jgi:hypothetical protein
LNRLDRTGLKILDRLQLWISHRASDVVIADLLFAGDVNQCDFFTVQANSPAAQLGFANITKLAKWTRGCDTDDDNQFYHW